MKAVTDDSLSVNTTISMPRSNDDPRRHVQILPERVGAVSLICTADANSPLQVSGSEFPGHYPGEDHSWNLDKFKEVSAR